MELRPILSTLRRHKTASALIVLEIALSCAIICNALFLIGGRLDRMDRVSGIAEDTLVRVQLTGIGNDDNAAALTKTDLAALRAVPGVEAASVSNQIVYGNGSWNSSVNLARDQTQPTLSSTIYLGDEQMLDTLGLNLVAGRDFTADDFVEWDAVNAPDSKVQPHVAIITRSMADKLYPGQDPLGKAFYSWGDEPTRVVGIVEHLVRPNEQDGPTAHEYSMLLPLRTPYTVGGNYLLRVSDPSR